MSKMLIFTTIMPISDKMRENQQQRLKKSGKKNKNKIKQKYWMPTIKVAKSKIQNGDFWDRVEKITKTKVVGYLRSKDIRISPWPSLELTVYGRGWNPEWILG